MYSTDNIVYCMNCMNYSHYYVDNFILVWITIFYKCGYTFNKKCINYEQIMNKL